MSKLWTPDYICMHWVGSGYTFLQEGHYHDVVQGDGTITMMTDHRTKLYRALAGRNGESISISLACMGGLGFSQYPPTKVQIENMCKYVAKICKGFGWEKEVDKRCWTHAELAANRDKSRDKVDKAQKCLKLKTDKEQDLCASQYGLPHANYGCSYWFDGWPGGTAVRWDLAQLQPTDKMGEGGYILRKRIKEWILKL